MRNGTGSSSLLEKTALRNGFGYYPIHHLTYMESTLMYRMTLVLILSGWFVLQAEEPSDKIAGLGPVGPAKKLFGDFKFVEGPAADPQGNVYFTDIPNNKIHKIDKDGKLSTFTDQSNKANGLMFNAKGELIVCEMEGQVVAYSMDGKRRVLADKFNGVRFNAPNDLVIDKSGGIYFTDPEYNAPKPFPQKIRTFYYIDNKGTVTRLFDEDLPNPNGIILSPDEKTLYVIPSSSPEMLAFPIEAPGKVGKKKVFCTLEGKGGGDGLTVDVKGNLYITTALGLQVFDPKGQKLGIIKVPEHPANVTFAGKDNKVLYVTARTGVYAIPMEISGHVFSGK
jgi:gluconolactonase